MPYGLPAATVAVVGTHAQRVKLDTGEPIEGPSQWVPSGRHLSPLYRGADQDGWQGEIICRDPARGGNYGLAIQPQALALHEKAAPESF